MMSRVRNSNPPTTTLTFPAHIQIRGEGPRLVSELSLIAEFGRPTNTQELSEDQLQAIEVIATGVGRLACVPTVWDKAAIITYGHEDSSLLVWDDTTSDETSPKVWGMWRKNCNALGEASSPVTVERDPSTGDLKATWTPTSWQGRTRSEKVDHQFEPFLELRPLVQNDVWMLGAELGHLSEAEDFGTDMWTYIVSQEQCSFEGLVTVLVEKERFPTQIEKLKACVETHGSA